MTGNNYARGRGFSLLELLIAMTIGLAITGAAMSIIPATSSAAREQQVQAALAQDAHSALAVMAAHLRMAGYRKNPGAVEAGIRGCDQRFAAVSAKSSMADFVCPASASKAATGSSEIGVQFEVDVYNSAPVDGRPSDCIRSAIFPDSSGALLSRSRFYINSASKTDNPSLYCDGNGGGPGSSTSAQAIIENVEKMRVSFSTDSPVLKTAREVDALPGRWSDKWRLVKSVEVCLLLRSDAGVVGKPAPYIDCDGKTVTPPAGDTRLRHAFSQTVQLRNHVPFVVAPASASSGDATTFFPSTPGAGKF